MSIVYKIAGVALTDRVRLMAEGDGFTAAAYRGEVGTSGVTVHDETGTLTIQGWQTFTVEDDESFPDPRVFTGFIVERNVGRGDSERTTTARTFDCDVVDLNTLLNTALFRTNAAKRPAESDLDRIAYMLTSEAMTANVFEHGLIASSPEYNFLASDLRGRYPNDAMMEMAPSAVRNFFVYRDSSSGDASLFYDADTAAVYSSSLRISNLESEIDGDGSKPGGTTFGPSQDATLSVEPNDVYCGVWYSYAGGDPIYVHSAIIHAAFFGAIPTHRDAVYDNPRIGVLATAQQAAKDWLNVRSGEERRITVVLYVPSGRVNWVREGHRMEVKFTHLAGLTSFTWARVRRRTVKPAGPRTWEMRLELWIPPTPVTDAEIGSGCVGESSFAELQEQAASANGHASPYGLNEYEIVYSRTGDDPEAGWPSFPKSGLIDYAPVYTDGGADLGEYYRGLTVQGAGDVTVEFIFDCTYAASVSDVRRQSIYKNGVEALFFTDSSSAPGLFFVAYTHTVAGTITVEAGDVLSGLFSTSGATGGAITIGGGLSNGIHFRVSGDLCDDDPDEIALPFVNDPVGPEVPTGDVDGANNEYLAAGPWVPGTLRVYHDGIDQTAHIASQDAAAGTYQLDYSPDIGSTIRETYESA